MRTGFVASHRRPTRIDETTRPRLASKGYLVHSKGARTRIVSEVSGVKNTMFDYVIVGGGSAGCVLAARLSGDPTVKVALIEAGPPDDASEIHTPLAWPQLFKTQYDWDYAAEPEPWLDGRRVYLPHGRTLGGSSSINAMIYIRGNRADYDDWAAAGAAGWGYDAVLPYFIKAEANERCIDQYHGKFGPLSVSDSRSPHELYDAFIEAGLQAGWPYNADFNASQQDGVGRYQLTQRNGMRCSAAVAFLHPAIERTNLTVITSGLATPVRRPSRMWRRVGAAGQSGPTEGGARGYTVGRNIWIGAAAATFRCRSGDGSQDASNSRPTRPAGRDGPPGSPRGIRVLFYRHRNTLHRIFA